MLLKRVFFGDQDRAPSKRERKLKETLELAVRALFDYTSLYGADDKDESVYLAYKELCRDFNFDECCNLDEALGIRARKDSNPNLVVISSKIATRMDATSIDENALIEKLLNPKNNKNGDDFLFLSSLKPIQLTRDNTWGYDVILNSIECSYRGDEIALTRSGLSLFKKTERLSVFDVAISISGCIEKRTKNGTIRLLRRSTNSAINLDKNWIIED